MTPLEDLAQHLGLPSENLTRFGVRNRAGGIEIPYLDREGSPYERTRLRLKEGQKGVWSGWRWSEGEGKAPSIYGQWRPMPFDGKILVVVEGECLTGDAEVLTSSGWQRLDCYAGGPIVQWSPGGRLATVAPMRQVRKQFDGDLVRLTNAQRYFAQVTPEHKMPLVRGNDFRWANVTNMPSAWSIPRVGVLNGPGIVASDDALRLALAVSADAAIHPRKRSGPYVFFHLTKARKIARLRGILERLGIPYRDTPDRSKIGIAKRRRFIKALLPSDYERFGRRLLDHEWLTLASERQRRLLLDEMVEWDGNRVRGRTQHEYSSKYEANATWMQTLASTSGFCSTVILRTNHLGSWYKVSVLKKTATSVQALKRERVHFSGSVYCLTVPSGAFLVRQNGCISVTGNSDCWACWSAGIASIGVAGAENTGALTLADVSGAKAIAVVQEPDDAGARFPHRVAQKLYDAGFDGEVAAIRLAPHKDARAAYVADPDGFKAVLQAAWGKRTPLSRPHVQTAGRALSAAELLSMPLQEVKWMIDGLLPASSVMLLTSKPKVGKSVLARTLSLCVARGEPFLDREVSQGSVLWLCLDESASTFVPAMAKLGLRGSDPIRFYMNEQGGDALAWLEGETAREAPALVVIDTWQDLCRVENVNDYSQVKLALGRLKQIRESTGCCQVWIHHNNKGQGKNVDSVLGSTALFAGATTLLSIACADDDLRVAWSKQRTGENIRELVLSMDERGWVRAGGTQFDAEVVLAEPKVYAAIGGDALTTTLIIEAVDIRRQVVLGALRSLSSKGYLATAKDGRATTYRRASGAEPFTEMSRSTVPAVPLKGTSEPLVAADFDAGNRSEPLGTPGTNGTGGTTGTAGTDLLDYAEERIR